MLQNGVDKIPIKLNERIKEIRTFLNLSQAKFGEKLGISRDVVANIENDRVQPQDNLIKLICFTFNVNEEWLRIGKGVMFIENEETVINRLTDEYNLDILDRKIVECYLNLGPLQRKVIKQYLRSLVDSVIDESYDEYREQYLDEKADSVAARHGNTDNIDEIKNLYDNMQGDKNND